MTFRFSAPLLLILTLAACGNYSNEDLEFLNAVPAAEDISADIPRAPLLANEAEMAKLTHDTVAVFNGALDFLKVADVIRTYPSTSRITAPGPAPTSRQLMPGSRPMLSSSSSVARRHISAWSRRR